MKLKRYLLLVCLLCPAFACAQRPLTIVAGVVTANVADTNDFQVALTANVTGVTLVSTVGTNNAAVTPNTGYQITMRFVQDATGSRTVVFGGNITTSCTINATALSVTLCRWQYTATGNTWADTGGSSSSSLSVGGTFGASPSSGYTFTSTAIATTPFSGNLLVGANINSSAAGSYTAGSGYTLTSAGQSVLAMEYQVAGSATSYSAPFTYSVVSANWGGTIAAFSSPGNNAALMQGRSSAATNVLAYTSNNGAGNLLVVAMRYNGAGSAPMVSVTDTAGNTWVSAGERCFEGYSKGASDNNFLEIWYAMGSIAGANTVTANIGAGATGGVTNQIAIAEFSGIATSNALVDYNFTGSTVSVTNIPGATTNTQYTINAINNKTGVVDFTGRDSASVFRSAANVLANTPALMYFKNGIYPGQTSVQENTGGNTNWYVWGMPAPAGGNQGSWHIVCETFTQILYTSSQTDGCIHQVLPSAYAGPQPTSNTLSGFWQRPSGGTYGAVDFFVNNTVRIPDNQHTPSNSYDTFTAVFSSHVGTVADTNFVAGDQLCAGLTPAVANITGYRTNKPATDEAYFDNTWAIGFFTPYNVLSNHPIMTNAHAVCGQNAGILSVTTALYGGQLIHYGDYHNIHGLTFTCTNAGTRYDLQNMLVENALTGAFTRTAGAVETTPGNCMGKVDVTTASANGVVGALGNFWVAGSGTNFKTTESIRLIQPGMLASSTTSAATTGTIKQTLATYTFVYNTSGIGPTTGPFESNAGGVYRISAWGITAANANSKTVQLDFGGTAISTITSTVNNGVIRVSADIIVGSVASTQECNGYADDGTTHTVTRTSPGITGSANIILNLAATTGTSAGDFTFKGWTIEYLGGQ